MGTKTYRGHGTRQTPQSEPIPGTTQTKNRAGGYAWAVDCWQRFERFLILGTEGGTYYQRERPLTRESLDAVRVCVAEDGRRAVDIICAVSETGRAPKNDPALVALAVAAAAKDRETRRYALANLGRVARIGTHLLHFCAFLREQRGWGRLAREAVARWYLDRSPEDVAWQVAKYQSRDGWSHRDVLRCCHAKTRDERMNAVLGWAAGKNADCRVGAIAALRDCQAATTAKEAVAAIKRHDGVQREFLPTEMLGHAGVWAALLPGLGLTALIRNLGNLSKCGLLAAGNWDVVQSVCERITDRAALRRARVHPIQVLAASVTYGAGHGARGRGEWPVVGDVVDALDDAFHASFENVEPTGRRHYLALDVSGSMTWGAVSGVPGLAPNVAAAAMAMVTRAVEPRCLVRGFAHELREIPLSPRTRLREAIDLTDRMSFGATDCAQPMVDALGRDLEIDAFVVYTDSETWFGPIHPTQALAEYRRKTGIAAQLIVVAMVSSAHSIADPNDAGMLDVVGFDTATPAAIAEFVRMGKKSVDNRPGPDA